MKTERLLELALDLKADLSQTNIIALIDQLTAALQNQINGSNPAAQQATSQHLKTIETNLEKSRVNDYPPSWLRELEELKLANYFGSPLMAWIKSILERNQITVHDALNEIKTIRERLSTVSTSLNNLTSSLQDLGFQAEALQPNQYEVAVEIPRPAVKNELGELGKELGKLDRIFSIFSEIATGSRTRFQIRAIASSELSVFLNSVPAGAAMIALAIERMVTVYEKVLHILTLHRDLAQTDVPKNLLDGIQEHVEKTVQDGIEQYAKEFEEKYFEKVPKGRRPELSNELRSTLAEIAKRLDAGYGFDVRGGPTPQPTKGKEPSSEELELQKYREIVGETRQRIRFFKPEGEPILKLSNLPDREQEK